ncbi:MAG: hypothetical protein Q9166_005065 [cf. Caloplaca sp. 2 TL-2023]
MTKHSIIKDSSCYERAGGHDNSSQFPMGPSPGKLALEEPQMHEKKEKDGIACGEDQGQSVLPITCNPRKTLLDTLKQETENHLRTPLTPGSSGEVSEDGFPLGVVVAKNAYGQGLLSTGALYRECLPPALSVSKTPPSSGKSTDYNGPSDRALGSSSASVSLPRGGMQTENDGSSPVVKRRNLTHEAQLRRINQAPLSAIYEEPAGSQHACACGLCSESEGGRGIVWFHLCPRYAAMARENGIVYEPCEGRIIMHHGPDRSSVGLIIEGPMEDRFVPVSTPHSVPEASSLDKVKSPKPGRPDLRSMHSATGRAVRNLPRTMSGPKLHQLPPISTPALQRPISPATQVSHPTSLIPLSSTYCPKEGKSEFAQKVAHISKGTPATTSALSEENVHPAFRTRVFLQQERSRPPSPNHSQASVRNSLQECPRTPGVDSTRRSSNCSEFSEERPARTDSLGAPAYPGPSEKNEIRHSYTRGTLMDVQARHLTSSTLSDSLLSASANHERTPSVFLGPSTPSTASFVRSSVSSYGSPLPSQLYQLKEATATADAHEASFVHGVHLREQSDNYNPGEDPFSPQLSYHTAPDSHYAQSSSSATPQTGRTSISSLDRLRSHNPSQNSPFFETQGYLRYQASERSLAQTLGSLRLQRDDGITSSTNLLNGNAFDNVESMSQSGAAHAEGNDIEYDHLYIIENTYDGRSGYSANPLETVGATEAHYTDIVTSNKKPSPEPPVSAGLGISNSASTHTHQPQRHKALPTVPGTGRTAANEELEGFISKVSSDQECAEPLRRSIVVQQNLCVHPKLRSVLGIETTMSKNHRSSSRNNQSPAMTMNEVLPPRKEQDRLGFMKKGSQMFKEKRSNFADKMKAGFKVKPEDWQDHDDRY